MAAWSWVARLPDRRLRRYPVDLRDVVQPPPNAHAEGTTFSSWLCGLAEFSDVAPRGDPAPFAAGDCLLDRFEIRGLIGSGGMGFVFEAFDRRLDTTCALKTLRAMHPERVLMLKNEFRALAGVHHPNLVRPGNLMQTGEHWFFTMELVQGQDPIAWVGGDQLRLERVLSELAGVLTAMHERGILHRDVKPSNVIVAPPDRVVLVDLGLARDATRLLWFDRGAGTSLYMAPDEEPVGPKADLYALGVLLYQLATGKPPFTATAVELVAHKRDPKRIPSLAAARPDLPAELDRLFRDLLAVDPAARPDGSEVLARLRALGSTPGSMSPVPAVGENRRHERVPLPELVGRSSELERLRMAFQRVKAGQCAAVFVHGASGIGKTRLVEEFLAEATRSGALVLQGRCYEREAVAFKAVDGVIDAMAAALARLGAEERRALIPPEALPLARVFAALAALDVFAESSGDDRRASREDMLHALRALLSALSARFELVLFVDDLQWADRDGLELLAHALAPPEAPRILLVVCSRDAERPPAFSSLPSMMTMPVGTLSAEDARTLAQANLPGTRDDDIARIVRDAGGHPLFVQELARLSAAARDTQELGLDDVIWLRARALDERTRDLVDLVAVAGAPVSRRVLEHASERPPSELEQGLHVLEGERFCRSRTELVVDAFHDRVREALLARLGAERISDLHRRLALAYEQVSPEAAASLATHWAGAGDSGAAFRYALLAADKAIEGLAFAHAAELYALALTFCEDEEEQQRLRVARAGALASARRPLEAAEAFVSAALYADSDSRRRLRARAVEQLFVGGDLERGFLEIKNSLRDAGIATPTTLPSWALSTLVGRARLRVLRYPPAAKLLRTRGTAEDVDALIGASSALQMLDGLVAFGYHTRALLMAFGIGDIERLNKGLLLESCVQGASGSFAEAERLITRADALLPVSADLTKSSDRNGAILVLGAHTGRWDETLRHAAQVDSEPVESNAWQYAAGQLLLAQCEYNLGRFVELQERCDLARREVAERSNQFLELAFGVSFIPLVHVMRDEVADARRAVGDFGGRVWRAGGGGYFHVLHAVSSLFLELYEGEFRAALETPRPRGFPTLIQRAHYGRVYVRYLEASAALGALRDGGAGSGHHVRRVKRTIRALEGDPVPWAPAYGRLLAAGLHHVGGSSAAALRDLARARTSFARFGSEHMVDVIDRARMLAESSSCLPEVEARLAGRGVTRPDRFAAMLAPAFG